MDIPSFGGEEQGPCLPPDGYRRGIDRRVMRKAKETGQLSARPASLPHVV